MNNILDFKVGDRVTVGDKKDVFRIKNVNPSAYTEKFACLVDEDGKESIVTFAKLNHAEEVARSDDNKMTLNAIAQRYFPGILLYGGSTPFIQNLKRALEDAYDSGCEDTNTKNSG